ncbi:MAG: TonB-dependent receptor, partial [Caulobacter sp.]
EQKRVDRDSAAFGEVSFDITPKLTATAGVRFFKADNSLVGFYGYGAGYGSTGERACFKGAVVSGSPCTNLDKRVKETGNTPTFNLTYKFDDDKLIYATYSEGYRPGGINRRGTLPPYLSDYLKNYEFGWKTTWAQNRFRWNGSVYFEKWDKFQFSILGANGLTEIKNAGAADIKGVESDITWRPTRGLTINASAAYTDAKLSENYCGYTDSAGNPVTDCADPEAPDGTRLPVTPKIKANLTARYEFDLDDFKAFLQGSLVGQSGNWSDLRLHEREILGYQDGYTTVDLSGGFSRDSWTITAYLTNAFDERASQTRFVQCDEDTCSEKVYIIPIQPRTFGLKFGQKF